MVPLPCGNVERTNGVISNSYHRTVELISVGNREAVCQIGGALAHVIELSLNVPFTEYAMAATLPLSKAPPQSFSVALLITVQ